MLSRSCCPWWLDLSLRLCCLLALPLHSHRATFRLWQCTGSITRIPVSICIPQAQASFRASTAPGGDTRALAGMLRLNRALRFTGCTTPTPGTTTTQRAWTSTTRSSPLGGAVRAWVGTPMTLKAFRSTGSSTPMRKSARTTTQHPVPRMTTLCPWDGMRRAPHGTALTLLLLVAL